MHHSHSPYVPIICLKSCVRDESKNANDPVILPYLSVPHCMLSCPVQFEIYIPKILFFSIDFFLKIWRVLYGLVQFA